MGRVCSGVVGGVVVNLFIFTCGILQLAGAIVWIVKGQYWGGSLYVLYSFTNFILAYRGVG